MKIDVYYDVTCCHCAKSRSTDFEMGMSYSRHHIQRAARREGWGSDKDTGAPICPDCMSRINKNQN